jgi:hypothetical protein
MQVVVCKSCKKRVISAIQIRPGTGFEPGIRAIRCPHCDAVHEYRGPDQFEGEPDSAPRR